MAGVSEAQRLTIFRRDGWKCHYCRLAVVIDLPRWHPRRASVDHMHPKSRGGSNALSNLVACCNRCNSEKADIPYQMYLWYRHMLMRGHGRDELLLAIEEVLEEEEQAPVAQSVEAPA